MFILGLGYDGWLPRVRRTPTETQSTTARYLSHATLILERCSPEIEYFGYGY